ncbi:MAG: outer membrane beta-barrel protein, partial [Bacteroidota bacterium]
LFILLFFSLVSHSFAQSLQADLTLNQQIDLGWGGKIGFHNYFSDRVAVATSGRYHRYSFYSDGLPVDDDPNTVLRPPHDTLSVPYRFQEVSTGLGLRFNLTNSDRILIYIQPNLELSMMDFRTNDAFLSDMGGDLTAQIGMMLPITPGWSFQVELGLRYKGVRYLQYEASRGLTTFNFGLNYNVTGFNGSNDGIFCPLVDKGLMNLPNKEQTIMLEVPVSTEGEVGYGGRISSYTRVFRAVYLSTVFRFNQVSVEPQDSTFNPVQRELAVGIGAKWDFVRSSSLRLYINPTLEAGIFRLISPYPNIQISRGYLATTPSLGIIAPARSKVRFQGEVGYRYRFASGNEPDIRRSFFVFAAGLSFNISD